MMTEDKFWEIIGQSQSSQVESQAIQEAKLYEILSKLGVQDVVAFDKIFTQLRFRAYSHDMWGAAYIINGGCSNDGFEYFRCALIAAGREKYERALLDPESLADWIEAETEFEALMYVPDKVYREQTGNGGNVAHPDLKYPALSGNEWSDDSDLEKRFPKLCAKFGI